MAGNLIQITEARFLRNIDAALADAATRSGNHLACRPGCAPCCHGVFAISQLDAERLRQALATAAPEIKSRIEARTAEAITRLTPDFPGNATSGILNPEDESFEHYANEEPCPVLDPITQTCDLYQSRPTTCRTFGPPVRDAEGNLAVCELCFTNAKPEAIAAAEMHPDPENLEPELIAATENKLNLHGETIIAFALRNKPSF